MQSTILSWWLAAVFWLIAATTTPTSGLVQKWAPRVRRGRRRRKLDKRIMSCRNLIFETGEEEPGAALYNCIKDKLQRYKGRKRYITETQVEKIAGGLQSLFFSDEVIMDEISNGCDEDVNFTRSECVAGFGMKRIARTIFLRSNETLAMKEFMYGWKCPRKRPWDASGPARDCEVPGMACDYGHRAVPLGIDCKTSPLSCLTQYSCQCAPPTLTWVCQVNDWRICRGTIEDRPEGTGDPC